MSEAAAIDARHYRRWPGQLRASRWTWLAIVRQGVRLQLREHRKRNLLLLSLGFTVMIAITLYILTALETLAGTKEAESMIGFIQAFLRVDLSGITRITELREVLWRTLFLVISKGQLAWVLVVVSMIGPGLIANDIRSRALPIYFSKPVTPSTYLLGKWIVIAIFVGAATFIPSVVGLIIGVAITGGLPTYTQNLHLLGDVALAGLVNMLFAGLVILAISSLTRDQRYAAGGWIALCLLSIFAQALLTESLPKEQTAGWLGSISLYRDMSVVDERIFSVREAWSKTDLPEGVFNNVLPEPMNVMYPVSVIAGLAILGAIICYRRVARFSKAAASVQ